MNATPTIPNPTTTIRFLLVSFGSSPFTSISSIFSGRTFASASFHSLLLMLTDGIAKMNEGEEKIISIGTADAGVE